MPFTVINLCNISIIVRLREQLVPRVITQHSLYYSWATDQVAQFELTISSSAVGQIQRLPLANSYSKAFGVFSRHYCIFISHCHYCLSLAYPSDRIRLFEVSLGWVLGAFSNVGSARLSGPDVT